MRSKDEKWWKSFHKGIAEQSRYLGVRPAREVEQPTYKVVGEIGRVDQRDTMQARQAIHDVESPEYEDYYRRHPERKSMDDKLRANMEKAVKNHFKKDPFGACFMPNVFATRHLLGLPEMIEPGKEETPLWEILETDNTKTDHRENQEFCQVSWHLQSQGDAAQKGMGLYQLCAPLQSLSLRQTRR